jgi:hypothetical protein
MAGISAPLSLKAALRDAHSNTLEARRVAYALTPLNADTDAELARNLDELASAVHIVTTAPLDLCNAVERALAAESAR